MKTKNVTYAALIAAIYVVLTYAANLFGLASGAIQVRISEALCVLPAFTPAAIPGLFIGCFVSNLLTGCALWDVVFGSVATLLGALGTYYFGKSKYLAPIFPIAANTVIVPFVLKYVYMLNDSVWYLVLTVFIGEVISCGILGAILYNIVKKSNVIK
ncbi:MAG: QueT transporter family protein [Clostridia bacterium]|nr:QueT transporter family protein [Clostridia bacterium]